MNKIQNDYGELVVAVGAPGSIARVKCERPGLIDSINRMYDDYYGCPGRGIDDVIEAIRKAGIRSSLQTRSILAATRYAEEPQGSVTSLVMSISS